MSVSEQEQDRDRNLRQKRKKRSGLKGQLLKSTKISKTKEPQGGRQTGSLYSLWLTVFIRDSHL